MNKIIFLITVFFILIEGCSQQNKKESTNQNSPIADSLLSKGWNKIMSEDFELAIADFNKLIEIEPRNIKAFTSRGMAKRYQKDYEGAISDYNIAIELAPNDVYIVSHYTHRGHFKYYNEDYSGAIADFTKAIELDQYTDEAYWLRALVKNDLGDFRGAIDDFSKYIDRPNGNPANQILAWYYRGIAKIEIGQKDAGCMDLSKAGELGYSKAYEAIKRYCN